MKKLMITIAAVSSVAYMAKADLPTGTSFERLDAGTAGSALIGPDVKDGAGATYWATDINADISQTVVTEYDGNTYANPVGRPDQFVDDGEPNNNYLKIDTTGRLTRNIDVNSTGDAVAQNLAEAPVFFDSLVQFTAAEDAPEVTSGDKLVVWLQGTDGENAATNLVITAGDVNGETMERVNFVIDNTAFPIDQNAWYRLTIKAVDSIVTYSATKAVAGFVVYIDGEPVARTETLGDFTDLGGLTEEAQALNSDKFLFPSLVQPGATGCRKLTSVSFEGTGAVDDLSFSTTAPAFMAEPVVETYTLTVTAENASVQLTKDYEGEEPLSGESSPYSVPVTLQTVYAAVTPDEGYTTVSATLNGVSLVAEEEGGMYYFALTMPEGTVSGSTVAFAVTASTGGGEVTTEFPETWNSGEAVSDAIKTKYAAWAAEPGNDPTATGAETAFLLGVATTGTEPELTAKIEIVDGKVVVTTEPALDNANGQVLLYKAATLEGLKIATPVEYTDGVTTDDDAGEAGFYKVTVGYPTAE